MGLPTYVSLTAGKLGLLEHIDKMGLGFFSKAGLNNLFFPRLLLRGGKSSWYGTNTHFGKV